MNPLTNVKNITKLSEKELELGIDTKNSWHNMYKDSAWIHIGGLHFDLSEGDIISVFSQYGEVVNINLVRDRKTGKSRGFAFLCYQDQRSTTLAVDNLNGIKLLNRTIKVDHVQDYKPPKEMDNITTELKQLYNEGCAPKPLPIEPVKSSKPKRRHSSDSDSDRSKYRKKHKKHKKEKKIKKHKHHH